MPEKSTATWGDDVQKVLDAAEEAAKAWVARNMGRMPSQGTGHVEELLRGPMLSLAQTLDDWKDASGDADEGEKPEHVVDEDILGDLEVWIGGKYKRIHDLIMTEDGLVQPTGYFSNDGGKTASYPKVGHRYFDGRPAKRRGNDLLGMYAVHGRELWIVNDWDPVDASYTLKHWDDPLATEHAVARNAFQTLDELPADEAKTWKDKLNLKMHGLSKEEWLKRIAENGPTWNSPKLSKQMQDVAVAEPVEQADEPHKDAHENVGDAPQLATKTIVRLQEQLADALKRMKAAEHKLLDYEGKPMLFSQRTRLAELEEKVRKYEAGDPRTNGEKGDGNVIFHPPHYNHGKYEPIDVIEDWKLGFNLASVVKYICRAEHKGTIIKDLEKARFYLSREIQLLQKLADAGYEVNHDPNPSGEEPPIACGTFKLDPNKKYKTLTERIEEVLERVLDKRFGTNLKQHAPEAVQEMIDYQREPDDQAPPESERVRIANFYGNRDKNRERALRFANGKLLDVAKRIKEKWDEGTPLSDQHLRVEIINLCDVLDRFPRDEDAASTENGAHLKAASEQP